MAAIQMNTRMDASLKQQGDSVFARYGYSPSLAVRSLWDYVASWQTVPEFMKPSAPSVGEGTSRLIVEGAGMALRLAREERLVSEDPNIEPIDRDALRDAAYADLLQEYELNHV